MTISDFIGAEIKVKDQIVEVSYVGIVDGYLMFGFMVGSKIKTINSNKVIIEIEYINRPTFHGETYFIGPSIVTARWTDDEYLLIKRGRTKVLDIALSEVRLREVRES